jgi:hypothetical protein
VLTLAYHIFRDGIIVLFQDGNIGSQEAIDLAAIAAGDLEWPSYCAPLKSISYDSLHTIDLERTWR